MLERHHVEAWVNRNLWLDEDFEAIVNDIMTCGSDDEEVWLTIVDMKLERQGLAFMQPTIKDLIATT